MLDAAARDRAFRDFGGAVEMAHAFYLGARADSPEPDRQIELGPCTESYTVDNILNMGAARRELAEHGSTTVVMRLAERFPAVRHLGAERPQ
ncbi:hypothetical protein [Streptomyces sp. NPDC091219]|uniref:hypothetical protein n=1 Tax=Streptomyces sp. NPDC091219 TaxID=3155193 RepID=UPI0034507518